MRKLDDYQRLAALITATDGIEFRRLQKLVFVLEALGAPFRYRYQMHFNEPYSEDLEADISLLVVQGFATQDEEPKTGFMVIRPSGPATVYLDLAEELKPHLKAIAELARADTTLLDFVTTFGAWRELQYGTTDALERTVRSTSDRRIDAEGERLLKKLGLLATS
jgi:uncharacterized protein YwgA